MNLFKHKNLRGRLARWFVTLQNYEINFEYIPGKKNTAADALSRNILSQEEYKQSGIEKITIRNREKERSSERVRRR